MLNEEIGKLQKRVQEFAKERDWNQFHTLKNLSMALSVESSELMEHFQWVKDDFDLGTLTDNKKECVQDEMIDIFIYWMRIADRLEMNVEECFERKFKKNQDKYPAELVRGSHKKYTEY